MTLPRGSLHPLYGILASTDARPGLHGWHRRSPPVAEGHDPPLGRPEPVCGVTAPTDEHHGRSSQLLLKRIPPEFVLALCEPLL